jgi:hypothetical protein
VRFEHLVQINDPLMPLLDLLTREQVWRGLVLRAEQPTQFVLGLAGYAIRQREELAREVHLQRTLDFGSFAVRDHVQLVAALRSVTHTQAGATWPASRLTIAIEEPAPEQLFLRFVYEFEAGDDADAADPRIDALRREAYRMADLDTVARIRRLAELGELG